MTTWPGRVVVGNPHVTFGAHGRPPRRRRPRCRGARPWCPAPLRRHGPWPRPARRRVRSRRRSPRAPLATSAVYSPRLCPAQAAGVRPIRSTASSTTRLSTVVASWAFSVWVSSLIGASQQEVGQVALGRRGRFLDHLPGRVIDPRLTHAGALRSLSGEGEDQHVCDVSHRRRAERSQCGTPARPHPRPDRPFFAPLVRSRWFPRGDPAGYQTERG